MTSVSGAGAGPSLMQMARLFSQIQPGQTAGASTTATRSTDTSTPTSDTNSTDTTSADLVAELQSFFRTALSSDTMGGLLQAQGGGHGDRVGPPPGGGEAPSLSDIDSNGDGSISKTEFESFGASESIKTSSASSTSDTSKADEMFSKMDTNGDGSISADEKTAFDKTMQASRPLDPPPGQPPSDEASNGFVASSSDTAQKSMAEMMQQLLAALQSYASASSGAGTDPSTTSTSATATTSVAA